MKPAVALIRCESYADDKVEAAVSSALASLGGIGKFVKPGNRVLLKVNLLSASEPDKAITTHPSVVKAVVKQVQSAGGVPVIADSPGGPFNRLMLDSAYKRSGLKEVADETGAALNYDTGSHQASYPHGVLLKRIDVIDVLDEVDVVITVPKLKTHTFMRMTGAAKILFGVVPGLTKPAYHLKFPEPERFSDMLLDILGYVKPALCVMDAVVGMEGDGPGSGGTPKKAGLILAGADSVAVDIVAASVIGMKPEDVPVLKRAGERGLTSCRVSDVEVLGEDIKDVKTMFRQPAGPGKMSKALGAGPLNRALLRVMVPYPSANNNCNRCAVCKESCPADAITIKDRAHMDLKKCIRCYCCHELCPRKAIDLKTFPGLKKR